MPSRVVDWKTITDFVTEAFVKYGVPEADAAICSDILLESDRRGIESHGVNRFKPMYLDRIKSGVQKAVTHFEIVREGTATVFPGARVKRAHARLEKAGVRFV